MRYLIMAAILGALIAGCGDDDDGDKTPTQQTAPRPAATPTVAPNLGVGGTAVLSEAPLVAVRTAPAATFAIENLQSAGVAGDEHGNRIPMASAAEDENAEPWELISGAPDGWLIWQPQAVLSALGEAGAGATVTEAERVEWPDACLGAAEAGEVCAEVITSGYRVVIGNTTYHTDLSGENIRVAPGG
ncbi:MAG: hypothetical protein WEC75_01060 [Dehalococcoidia bacterium]